MIIPEGHMEFLKQNAPAFSEDAGQWVDMLLNDGVNAPAEEMPGNQWYMPGGIVERKPFDTSYRTGPAGVRKDKRPYMIVAVSPSFGDYSSRRVLGSPVGRILEGALKDAGFDLSDVYYTTIVRHLRPKNATSYKTCWLNPGWHYFLEEFKRVNPCAVLFLGSEPMKLAFGRMSTLNSCRCQAMDFNGVKATVATSHLNFISNTAGLPVLIRELQFFKRMGCDPSLAEDGVDTYKDRDYHVLNTEKEIEDAVNRAINDPAITELAVDIEGGNDTGRPEHDYVTTFQWSHAEGNAYVIPLYIERPEKEVPLLIKSGKRKGEIALDSDGNQILVPEYGGSGVSPKCQDDKVSHYDKAVECIRKLFECKKFRWIGHGVREDLKWCRDSLGIPFHVIRDIIREGRLWDTMLAYHILAKDAFGLKQLVLRFTDMGAYDASMHRWVIENSGAGKLFPGGKDDRFFHAYRDIAYKYLIPYALCDADATFRVYKVLCPELEKEENKALKRLYYEVELPVQSGIMDIETNGMPADPDRLTELTEIYVSRQEEIIRDLREACKWPDLNPGSSKQLASMIYAGPFKEHEKHKEKMPEGSLCLNLTPILTTGKYPKKWHDVQAEGHEEYESPSTSHDTIVKLISAYDLPEQSFKILDLVRQFASLKNYINTFLKEPLYTTLTGPVHSVYGKGLRSCIDSRGKVCCRISQLSETGRWRHSKPNLAQLPKKKEKAVAEIFTEEDFKVPKVRSGFKARPGWVLMEADWCSAEMFVMGLFSKDAAFIKVLQSGLDIHGSNAVNVFKLDCHPDEVKEKYPDRRDAVKTIGFGIAYGLSVSGLAEQLSVVLKRTVSVDEAKDILEKFFAAYPDLQKFFEDRKAEVETQGYVETMYGRRRYFPGVSRLGSERISAAKREAMNAPIQGTVADMLNIALINLDRMRYDTDVGRLIGWEVVVGIHDALLVHVPEEYVTTMAKILKFCMSDSVPLPGTGGVTLGVDVEYGERWGEFEPVNLAA